MWPRILNILPDATLNIFCNLEHSWVNGVAPDEMKEIKILLKINKKGIINHGWVSKDKLYFTWEQTEYFLYPCKFIFGEQYIFTLFTNSYFVPK